VWNVRTGLRPASNCGVAPGATDALSAGQLVAEHSRRQYEQLVDRTIPMIESTLEVEVITDNLLNAPLPDTEKKAFFVADIY
jgi:hypothetical protein